MSRSTVFLKEMGLGPVWSLRQAAPSEPEIPESAPAHSVTEVAPLVQLAQRDARPLPPNELAEEAFVDDFAADAPPPFFDDVPWEDDAQAKPKMDVSGMDWEQLEATILKCTACGLCRGRTQAVPGIGDRQATWLFIGEGPGFSEDQQGEPFVGPSGKLLDNMLLAMQLRRGENAYIANIVKCRPTDDNGRDRPPTLEEAAACRPFLDRQIALIQPEIIVALGKTAAMMLLNTDPQVSLATMRGKAHVYVTPDGREIPLVATYHPAYLLRQLSDKQKAWADLCLAMSVQAGRATDG